MNTPPEEGGSHHTYFEFFDVARAGTGGLGHSGLAFGVDEPGALQRLQAWLAPEFPVEQTTITRQLGDRQTRRSAPTRCSATQMKWRAS